MIFNRVDVWEAETPYTYRIEREDDTYIVYTWTEGEIEWREGWVEENTYPTMHAAMEWCRQDKREKEEWESGKPERDRQRRERMADIDRKVNAGEKLTLEEYAWQLRLYPDPLSVYMDLAAKEGKTEWGLKHEEES